MNASGSARVGAVLVIGIAAAIGLALGFLRGRAALEARWAAPPPRVTPSQQRRASVNDADPTAIPGRPVFVAMPIARARAALRGFTEHDPAVVPIADVGLNDEGLELHVVVENRGKCALSYVHGIAYGFDPDGRSTAMNRGGEHYVAFASDVTIPPGSAGMLRQRLRHAKDATLAVAHVDGAVCADGASWNR